MNTNPDLVRYLKFTKNFVVIHISAWSTQSAPDLHGNYSLRSVSSNRMYINCDGVIIVPISFLIIVIWNCEGLKLLIAISKKNLDFSLIRRQMFVELIAYVKLNLLGFFPNRTLSVWIIHVTWRLLNAKRASGTIVLLPGHSSTHCEKYGFMNNAISFLHFTQCN